MSVSVAAPWEGVKKRDTSEAEAEDEEKEEAEAGALR